MLSNLCIISSSTNLASHKSRSMKSMSTPWYQKPILQNNKYVNIQRGAMIAAVAAIVSVFETWWTNHICNDFYMIFQLIALFTIATAIFDVYCLAMAAPGSKHYGYFLISYEFVYVGNRHSKNS